VADRYAGYLGADTAGVVEELLHSQFVGFIRSLPTLVNSLKKSPMSEIPLVGCSSYSLTASRSSRAHAPILKTCGCLQRVCARQPESRV
jgi:hypothetical protein